MHLPLVVDQWPPDRSSIVSSIKNCSSVIRTVTPAKWHIWVLLVCLDYAFVERFIKGKENGRILFFVISSIWLQSLIEFTPLWMVVGRKLANGMVLLCGICWISSNEVYRYCRPRLNSFRIQWKLIGACMNMRVCLHVFSAFGEQMVMNKSSLMGHTQFWYVWSGMTFAYLLWHGEHPNI